MVEPRRRRSLRSLVQSGGTPSLFVLVALIALLVVPLVVEERLDDLRDEVEEVAEPARILLADIQYLLARQGSVLRGYLATGDASYLEQYQQLFAREREIYPELEGHAGSLGSEILRDVVELRTLSEQWHQRVSPSELAGRLAANGPDRLIGEALYVEMLDRAARGDAALRELTRARRDVIRNVERRAQVGYILLVVLALAATAAIASLNARIERLAWESNQRRVEAERALEEIDRAIAARTDLIRGFTHDVKNPLGAADGYAHLLEAGVRGPMTEEQRSTVASIRRSIGGAIEIIEQLLDISRLEGGGLTIRREAVSVSELMHGVVRHFEGVASRAEIHLTLVAPKAADQEAVVYSDPDRIRQVLDNLITNALKYTGAGGRVLLSYTVTESDDAPRPGSWLKLSVSDNGPGVPAEELERIFDEFHRVPGTTGRGHGLGLAISRRVARLLGGDVTVRSTLGEGSTFCLWLPVRESGSTS